MLCNNMVSFTRENKHRQVPSSVPRGRLADEAEASNIVASPHAA